LPFSRTPCTEPCPTTNCSNTRKKSLRSEIDYLLANVEAAELALLRDVLAAAVNEDESPDVAGRFRMIAWISTDKRPSLLKSVGPGAFAQHRSREVPIQEGTLQPGLFVRNRPGGYRTFPTRVAGAS
jgi:hypothetical protein